MRVDFIYFFILLPLLVASQHKDVTIICFDFENKTEFGFSGKVIDAGHVLSPKNEVLVPKTWHKILGWKLKASTSQALIHNWTLFRESNNRLLTIKFDDVQEKSNAPKYFEHTGKEYPNVNSYLAGSLWEIDLLIPTIFMSTSNNKISFRFNMVSRGYFIILNLEDTIIRTKQTPPEQFSVEGTEDSKGNIIVENWKLTRYRTLDATGGMMGELISEKVSKKEAKKILEILEVLKGNEPVSIKLKLYSRQDMHGCLSSRNNGEITEIKTSKSPYLTLLTKNGNNNVSSNLLCLPIVLN